MHNFADKNNPAVVVNKVKDLIDYFCLLALKKGLLFKVKPAFTGFH